MTAAAKTSSNAVEMNGWTATALKIQLWVASPIVFTAVCTLGTWLVASSNTNTQAIAVMTQKNDQAIIEMSKKIDSMVMRQYTQDASRADLLLFERRILTAADSRYLGAHWERRIEEIDASIKELNAIVTIK
jgi:hypothetical protein